MVTDEKPRRGGRRAETQPDVPVAQILQRMLVRDFNNDDLARLLGVTPGYLADLKMGRRPVTAQMIERVRKDPKARNWYPRLVQAIVRQNGLVMPFPIDAARPAQMRLATILALFWDDMGEPAARRLGKLIWQEYERHERGEEND